MYTSRRFSPDGVYVKFIQIKTANGGKTAVGRFLVMKRFSFKGDSLLIALRLNRGNNVFL